MQNHTSYKSYTGWDFCSPSNFCSACQGDCDYDHDCAGDLKCYQRIGEGNDYVTGCSPSAIWADVDYCYDPTDVNIPDEMQTGHLNNTIFVWP